MPLLLGISVGLMILYPPFSFLEDVSSRTIVTMGDPNKMSDILLLFEVLIMPPIIYESSCFMYSKMVFTRLGTIILTQSVSMFLQTFTIAIMIRIIQMLTKSFHHGTGNPLLPEFQDDMFFFSGTQGFNIPHNWIDILLLCLII